MNPNVLLETFSLNAIKESINPSFTVNFHAIREVFENIFEG